MFQGPKLIGDIKQALVEAVQEAKVENLTPLIGRDSDQWAECDLGNLAS